MTTKRPHKTLTLAEKYNILQQLENGVTGTNLAKKYGIGTSTISDIKKNSEKIKRYVDNSTSDRPFRKKTLREAEFPEMETELCTWFKTERDIQGVVSSNLLSEKAKELYTKHYGNNKFKASPGWLTNFKKRCNIRYHFSPEKSINEPLVSQSKQFLKSLRDKINELQLLPSQIYVLEGSALFWKMLPFGPKSNKERIKFLACTNIDGTHKLKLAVIGKDKYWRTLKNTLIPVEYYSDQNGETLPNLLQTWFHQSFVEQTRHFLTDNRVILVVKNDLGHALETILTDKGGKIITMVVPQNFTETTHNSDQNIISLIKSLYRKNLLVNILSFEDNDIYQSLNKINFKDCIFHLAIAWNQVDTDFIKNYYNTIFLQSEDTVMKLFPSTSLEFNYDSEYLILLSTFRDKLSNSSLNEEQKEVTEIIETMKNIEAELELNEQILIEDVDRSLSDDYESEIKDEEVEVKNEDAIQSFDICIQWAEQNGAELNDLITLRCLKLKSMYEKQKNLNMPDNF